MQALALLPFGPLCPARALDAHDPPGEARDPQDPLTRDGGTHTLACDDSLDLLPGLAGNGTPFGADGNDGDSPARGEGADSLLGGAGDDRLISVAASCLIGSAANDIFRPDVNGLSGHPSFADPPPGQDRLQIHCPPDADSEPDLSLNPDPSVNAVNARLGMNGVLISCGIAPGDSVLVPKAPT